MKQTDDMKKIMELQAKISEALRKDNGVTVHFEFSTVKGSKSEVAPLPGHSYPKDREGVQAFTYNESINEFFLLYSAVADTKAEALNVILSYVKNHKKTMKSYTVEWYRHGDTKSQKSYFYCENAQDVLNKFNAGKDLDMYEITALLLNPAA